MEKSIESQTHTHGDILKVCVCPKCKVIYKLRTTNQPVDGIHRCNECGAVVEPDKVVVAH